MDSWLECCISSHKMITVHHLWHFIKSQLLKHQDESAKLFLILFFIEHVWENKDSRLTLNLFWQTHSDIRERQVHVITHTFQKGHISRNQLSRLLNYTNCSWLELAFVGSCSVSYFNESMTQMTQIHLVTWEKLQEMMKVFNSSAS